MHKDHRKQLPVPSQSMSSRISAQTRGGRMEKQQPSRKEALSGENDHLHHCSAAGDVWSCPQPWAGNILIIPKQNCLAPSVTVETKPTPVLPAALTDLAGNKNPWNQQERPGGFCSSVLRLCSSSMRGSVSICPPLATLTVAKS